MAKIKYNQIEDINALDEKVTINTNDIFLIEDSEDVFKVKKVKATSLHSLPVIEVNTYEDIPLEEGTYLINTELPSNPPEPPYELSLNTNVYRFDDGYRYKLKELVTVSQAVVIRELVGKRTDIDQIFFKDSLYVAGTGEFIGECYYNVLQADGEEYVEYFFNVADTLRIPFNNYYIRNENFKSIGFLNLTMDDIDIEQGLIITKIPFSQDVTKSHVFLDSKEISGVKIGIFEGFLSVNYNNGELVNNVIFKNLTLRFEFETIGSTLNNNSYVTKSLINSKLNTVNAETTQVHSNAMVNTFTEAYDINNGFPNQIYKDTYPNILNFKEKDKVNAEILNTNCDIIFSAEPLFFSGLRSFYTESLITLPVGSNSLARIDLTSHIDEFPKNYIAVTSRAETDNDGTDPLGTSYGFGTEFNEPTLSADLTGQGLTDWPGSQEHQQSPATAIVAGKLKKIKDETGASWDIVRLAARQTASNAGSYNIYRGFGVIDVNAAIAAIPAMLDARSLELAEYFEATSKFPKELKYEDKLDNTPVVKRDIENYDDFLRLSTPYTSPPQILSGSVIFQNQARFTFGTSFQLWSNGSEGRFTLLSHDLKIRDGSKERFTFERTTGAFKANKFQLNDLNTAPASSTAPGTKGEIRVTSDFIYVCVATNTWKRTALSTW